MNSFYGFTCMSDFIGSLFGLKYGKLIIGASIIGGISAFFTNFWVNNGDVLILLWLLGGLDILTGVMANWKEFTSRKFPRGFIIIFFNSLLIFLSWKMGDLSFYFKWLPGFLIAGFLGTYLVSMIENLAKLGLIQKPIADVIRSRFGLKAIIKKLDRKEESDPDNF
jgi:hypothetical protein